MRAEDCHKCGMCKANCPIYKILLSETKSPRGKIILADKNILDKTFYNCSLCGACDEDCPLGISITDEIIKMREKLVEEGITTEPNTQMIKNIREFGNPYGKHDKRKNVEVIW